MRPSLSLNHRSPSLRREYATDLRLPFGRGVPLPARARLYPLNLLPELSNLRNPTHFYRKQGFWACRQKGRMAFGHEGMTAQRQRKGLTRYQVEGRVSKDERHHAQKPRFAEEDRCRATILSAVERYGDNGTRGPESLRRVADPVPRE